MSASLPRRPATIIELLEAFFGEELTESSAPSFTLKNEKQANDLFDFHDEYLDKFEEFKITPRRKNTFNPLLWSPFENGGSFLGGAADDTIACSLVLFHSITITDELFVPLSGLAGGDLIAAPQRYADYVSRLARLRPLIAEGIVSIASDRSAYRTAPVDDRANFRDLDFERFAGSARLDLVKPYGTALGYLKLADRLNADVLIGDPDFAHWMALLHQFWGKERKQRVQSIGELQAKLDLNLRHQTIDDIISIRKNDEVFADWRDTMEKALSQKSEKAFREVVSDGIKSLDAYSSRRWSGETKAFVFGGAGIAFDLITGIPVVSGAAGIAVAMIDEHLKRRRERVTGAAQHLYLEMLRAKT